MTQIGLDVQFTSLNRLSDAYWKAKNKATRTLDRVLYQLGEFGVTTGDPILDYCLNTYGLFYKSMERRYQEINEGLRGNTGQLVLTEWNEEVGGGFVRHFKMGVLKSDTLEFLRKHYCIMPVPCFVTHEDVVKEAKLHTNNWCEDLEFWVPAECDGNQKWFYYHPLMQEYIRSLDTRPQLNFTEVIVGNDKVRDFFKEYNSGIPGGTDTFFRLEDRLRSFINT